MTDASTIALQQIIAQLGAIVDRLQSKPSYQDDADAALGEFHDKRERTKQKDTTQKEPVGEYIKKLIDLQTSPTLAADEITRYSNIAKIFSKVINIDVISKSIDTLRKSNEESAEQQRRQSLLGSTTYKPARKSVIEQAYERARDKADKPFMSFGQLAKLGILATVLKSLDNLLKKSPDIITPLTGISDVLVKWSTLGAASLISNFIKPATSILNTFIKLLTDKSIAENVLSLLKGASGIALKATQQVASFVGKNFAKLGSYLSSFFPKLMSNISSITSIFTESLTAVGSKLGVAATGKGFLGRLFTRILGPIAKITGLQMLRPVPGIGALISLYFAHERYKSGDTTGALIEVAAGLANLIPVPILGSALSFGIGMLNAIRDLTGETAAAVPISTKDKPQSWFSQALDNVGNLINKSCYDWPVLGPMIRSIEHFKAGNYLKALNSMVHIIPPIGWILDLIGFAETPTQGRPIGSFTLDTVKGMAKFLHNMLMSIPGVGNVLRSIEHFIAGDFEAGFAEILPQSVMKFLGSKPQAQQIKSESTASTSTTSPTSNSENKSPLITLPKTQQPQITQPTTRVEMSGINDLHTSMIQMNQAELSLLSEQRNLLNDNKTLLKIIAEQLRSLSPETSTQFIQTTPSVGIREELSSTRRRYLENKNVFGASLT